MSTVTSKTSRNTYESPLRQNRNVASNVLKLKENGAAENIHPQANGFSKKIPIQNKTNSVSSRTKTPPSTNNAVNLEDQFKAACDAIQNLPKNGPFQPSNEMLLKFYGYFKQATTGPCKTSRPSMFKVVERAKWDAW